MDFSTETKVTSIASIGGVISAILASTCCILPVVVALLGIGSFGLAAVFETYRIPLVILTYLILGTGFYFSYRKPGCGPDEACAMPKSVKRTRIMLWAATILATLGVLFPYYIGWFF